jgi:hypothetical protein
MHHELGERALVDNALEHRRRVRRAGRRALAAAARERRADGLQQVRDPERLEQETLNESGALLNQAGLGARGGGHDDDGHLVV